MQPKEMGRYSIGLVCVVFISIFGKLATEVLGMKGIGEPRKCANTHDSVIHLFWFRRAILYPIRILTKIDWFIYTFPKLSFPGNGLINIVIFCTILFLVVIWAFENIFPEVGGGWTIEWNSSSLLAITLLDKATMFACEIEQPPLWATSGKTKKGHHLPFEQIQFYLHAFLNLYNIFVLPSIWSRRDIQTTDLKYSTLQFWHTLKRNSLFWHITKKHLLKKLQKKINHQKN